jgi:hypothetical protein
MTTLVLDEKTEQTPIGTVIRSATDSVVEVRDEHGKLMATVLLADDEDGFDYAPYLAEVTRRSAELDRRARHPGPWLTTKQLLEGIQALERDE